MASFILQIPKDFSVRELLRSSGSGIAIFKKIFSIRFSAIVYLMKENVKNIE